MRGLLSVLVLGAAIANVVAPVQAGDDKWTPLFNGKDLTGWKIHPKPSADIVEVTEKKNDEGKVIAFVGKLKNGKEETLWRVENGLLIGTGPVSHLFSERGDYENFRYRIEAKINEGGNSGQYFRTAFGPNYPTGYEAQINSTHADKVKTGSLYGFKDHLIFEKLHAPDEYFVQEVTAIGSKITIKVNGKQTVDIVMDKAKFGRKGHFALQQHHVGSVVTFKKIEVIELPSTEAKN